MYNFERFVDREGGYDCPYHWLGIITPVQIDVSQVGKQVSR